MGIEFAQKFDEMNMEIKQEILAHMWTDNSECRADFEDVTSRKSSDDTQQEEREMNSSETSFSSVSASLPVQSIGVESGFSLKSVKLEPPDPPDENETINIPTPTPAAFISKVEFEEISGEPVAVASKNSDETCSNSDFPAKFVKLEPPPDPGGEDISNNSIFIKQELLEDISEPEEPSDGAVGLFINSDDHRSNSNSPVREESEQCIVKGNGENCNLCGEIVTRGQQGSHVMAFHTNFDNYHCGRCLFTGRTYPEFTSHAKIIHQRKAFSYRINRMEFERRKEECFGAVKQKRETPIFIIGTGQEERPQQNCSPETSSSSGDRVIQKELLVKEEMSEVSEDALSSNAAIFEFEKSKNLTEFFGSISVKQELRNSSCFSIHNSVEVDAEWRRNVKANKTESHSSLAHDDGRITEYSSFKPSGLLTKFGLILRNKTNNYKQTCQICKEVVSKGRQNHHVMNLHFEKDSFKCRRCSFSAKNLGLVLWHCRRKHSKAKSVIQNYITYSQQRPRRTLRINQEEFEKAKRDCFPNFGFELQKHEQEGQHNFGFEEAKRNSMKNVKAEPDSYVDSDQKDLVGKSAKKTVSTPSGLGEQLRQKMKGADWRCLAEAQAWRTGVSLRTAITKPTISRLPFEQEKLRPNIRKPIKYDPYWERKKKRPESSLSKEEGRWVRFEKKMRAAFEAVHGSCTFVTKYYCKTCQHRYEGGLRGYRKMLDHIFRHHLRVKTVLCGYCKYAGTFFCDLRSHSEKRHASKPFLWTDLRPHYKQDVLAIQAECLKPVTSSNDNCLTVMEKNALHSLGIPDDSDDDQDLNLPQASNKIVQKDFQRVNGSLHHGNPTLYSLKTKQAESEQESLFARNQPTGFVNGGTTEFDSSSLSLAEKPCQICGEIVQMVRHLITAHVLECHLKKPLLFCEYCSFGNFGDVGGMRHHIMFCHSGCNIECFWDLEKYATEIETWERVCFVETGAVGGLGAV